MRETKFGIIQSPLQADLDRVADGIVEHLNADMALLSVTYNAALVSLGISSHVKSIRDDRVHVPDDMACSLVIKSNAPMVLRDVRDHPEASETRYVQDGLFAGYIGVPIQNAEFGAIGSLCALTQEPSDWSDADVRYLQAIADNVENLILREMYRLESMDASSLASEYDHIIAAFALVRAEPTSIHDATGRLVFANRALTDLVPEQELEGARFKAVLLSSKEKAPLSFKTATGTDFRLSRARTSSDYFVCQWIPQSARLN
ncbi:MAG: GAF domain-containing protein [Pseudomonadota bacterium]